MLSRLMTGREQLILVFAAAAVLIGVISLLANGIRAEVPITTPDALEPIVVLNAPTPEPVPILPDIVPIPEPVEVAVSIQGAIARPGLYRLENNARVQDLIDHAGGLAQGADTADINLAARLIDASTLTVPAGIAPQREGESPRFQRRRSELVWNPPQYTVRGWQPDTPRNTSQVSANTPSASAPTATAGLVNINTASQDELETLPGIGPKYAAAIIAYRNVNTFLNIEELKAISGIGIKRLEAIRNLVRVK